MSDLSDNLDSRKRVLETPYTSSKRFCHQETPEVNRKVYSFEEMLAVPPNYFIKEGGQLFTRPEAQTFISIQLLAFEIDSLIEVSEKLIYQKSHYRSIAERQAQSNQPYLRCLQPILRIIHEQTPATSLSKIKSEINLVMAELHSINATLRQNAESNLGVAESLAGLPTNIGRDKRRLAEVQEELIRRIDGILTKGKLECGSMDEFCAQVFEVSEQKRFPDSPGDVQMEESPQKTDSSQERTLQKTPIRDDQSEEVDLKPPSRSSSFQAMSVGSKKSQNSQSQPSPALRESQGNTSASFESQASKIESVAEKENALASQSSSVGSPCRTQGAAEVLSALAYTKPYTESG